jgi:hypothetical protein
VRKRRVLSFFVLGSLLLNAGRPDELTNSSLKRALARLRSDVSVLAAGAT